MYVNKYSTNQIRAITSLNLIAVYQTVAYNKYNVVFIKENREFYGLLITKKGSGKITIKGREYIINENQFIFGKHSEIDRIDINGKEWEFFFYWFELYNIEFPLNQINDYVFTEEDLSVTFKIINLLQFKNFNKTVQANAVFTEMLIRFFNSIDYNTQNEYFSAIKQSVIYINENLDNKFKISKLAEICHVSEKHYRFLFNKYIGINPKKYITNAKLQKAKHLLQYPDLSVTEISDSLNFSSPNHFTNAFKNEFGVSPTNYRKNANFI